METKHLTFNVADGEMARTGRPRKAGSSGSKLKQ
ncbi:hypothetical protein PI125_g1990 [Phytophthora idaei]|nr:hypothetical protein PI125_g1990 [Phytophthora idaei]